MSYISKSERERVRLMFGGRCAYCGCELPERWHVDHVEPVVRYPESGFYGGKMVQLHPERNNSDNYMPACPPCNIDKHAMTPEGWKVWLRAKLNNLRKSPSFKLMVAHGLVKETGGDVTFYFERPTPPTTSMQEDAGK